MNCFFSVKKKFWKCKQLFLQFFKKVYSPQNSTTIQYIMNELLYMYNLSLFSLNAIDLQYIFKLLIYTNCTAYQYNEAYPADEGKHKLSNIILLTSI